VLFVSVAAATVGMTFSSGRPIGWGDEGLGAFMYAPALWLRYAFFTWNPLVSGGGAFPVSPESTALLPLAAFASLLHALGLPPVAFEAAYVYLVHFAAMSLVYLLARRLLLGSYARGAAVVAALAYDLSLYAASSYWRIYDINISLLVLAPFTLYVTCRYVDRGGPGFWTTTLASAGGLVLLASAFTDLAYVVPIGALAFCFLIWYAMRKHSGAQSLRAVCRAAAGWVLIGSAGALVLSSTIALSPSAYTGTGHTISSTSFLAVSSQYETLGSLLRGFAIGVHSPVWLAKDPPWRFAYYRPALAAVGVVLLLTTLLGPLWRTNRGVASVSVGVYALGLLGAMGSQGPTGTIFLWAFRHVPYFVLLRIPYLALAPLILIGSSMGLACGARGLASTFAATYSRVTGRTPDPRGLPGIAVLGAITTCVGIYGFPIETGVVLTGAVTFHGPQVTSEVSVPSTYHVLSGELRRLDLNGSCVLVFPLAVNGARPLAWHYGYDGPDDDWLLLGQRVVSSLHGATGPLSQALLAAMQGGFPSVIADGGLLGCSYVLLQSNSMADVYGGVGGSAALGGTANSALVNAAMASARVALARLSARLVWRGPSLALYRLPSEMVVPPVYARPVGSSSIAPALYSRQVSPTEWLVRAVGGRGKWSLVLNQSWDAGWTAYQIPSPPCGPCTGLAAAASAVVNTLSGDSALGVTDVSGLGPTGQRAGLVLPDANGWVLSGVGRRKRAEVALVYVPQEVVGYGALVSIVATLLLLVGAAGEVRSRLCPTRGSSRE
jgi:hypothetical protein